MINIVVTSKPVDGLFYYSYEYCSYLNSKGIKARVIVITHRKFTQQDYLDVLKYKYIHLIYGMNTTFLKRQEIGLVTNILQSH